MGKRPLPPPKCEVIVALPDPVVPVTHVRSTVLIGSLSSIKSDGYFERYAKLVAPAEHLPTLVGLVPGVWHPIAVGAAHYRACDALGFSPDEQFERGRRAVHDIGRSVFGTGLVAARSAGTTPWTILPHLPRFWARAYDGNGLAVYKLGPKEARIDVTDFALCETPYFRGALRGWMTAMLELFCEKTYSREERTPAAPDGARFRVQWV